MQWIPFSLREKAKCDCCGSTSYARLYTTEDGLFCNLECATTFRWRKRWNYMTPTAPQLQYKHARKR